MVQRNKITQQEGELRVKRALLSILVSAAMVFGSLPAMSADTGPLAPGAAAGVKQAQGVTDPPLIWLVGAGVVIALGILILSNNNEGGGGGTAPVTPSTPSTTTTTTTNP